MFQANDFSFVHKYFMAEKQAGLLFLIIGAIAVVLSVVFFFFIKTNPAFYKGLAVPLVLVGILQVVGGVSIYSRSDKQRMDVAYKMGMDPGFVKNTELPRMEKVMKNFVALKYAESALFLAGLILFVYFRTNESQLFWKGFGLSLAVITLLTWSADHFAERRGAVYNNALKQRIEAGPGRLQQPE